MVGKFKKVEAGPSLNILFLSTVSKWVLHIQLIHAIEEGFFYHLSPRALIDFTCHSPPSILLFPYNFCSSVNLSHDLMTPEAVRQCRSAYLSAQFLGVRSFISLLTCFFILQELGRQSEVRWSLVCLSLSNTPTVRASHAHVPFCSSCRRITCAYMSAWETVN